MTQWRGGLTSAFLALIFAAACGDDSDEDRLSGGSGDGDGDLGGANFGDGDSGDGDGDSGDGDGDSGDGDGDSGDGDTGDGDIGTACASSDQDARLTPANLLFVVDRSGSMNCNAPQYTEEECTDPVKQNPMAPSKWEETQDAIEGALDSLVGAENVKVGLTVFPQPDPIEACLVSTEPDVAIELLTDSHKTDLVDFLNGVAPQGETPIAGASLTSYNFLSQQLLSGDLEGNTFVVLFTDGAETCDVVKEEGETQGDPTAVFTNFLENKVADATLFNIRTFVIGAPGSEGARSPLSEIAFQGLTAQSESCDHGAVDQTTGDCHFDMTESDDFIGDLAAALTTITNDKALSCVYDVPEGNVDLNKVNVTYTPGSGDPVDILRDDSADCDDGAEGWQYTDDFTKITLCGEICDQVQEQDGLVSIVLGCPTQVVVVR